MAKISILKRFQSVQTVMLIALMGLSLAACGDDDEENGGGGSLKGTSWTITYSDDFDDEDDMIGTQVTFKSDGNVKFTPSAGWTYAKWEQSGSTLKITLGEGEPDDYMMGEFVISGNTATYKYSWYDVDGQWADDEMCTMELKKK